MLIIRRRVERSGVTDLVVERGEVAFESLVLALQSLHSGEVVADVVDVECLVFLVDPVTCLIGISVGINMTSRTR